MQRAYGHIYGFWLQACEELSPESNSFKVYIHPAWYFKIAPSHNLGTNKIPVSEAVHLLVLLEQTVLGSSAHEMEIALAGGEAAADGGP